MFAVLCVLQAVAFVDVAVLPMDTNRVIEHQTVVVQDGRITEIGPAAKVRLPAGTTQVEGRGRFLMPGFTEMHGHLPNQAAVSGIPGIVDAVLFLYVANGVTGVRGMQGNRSHIELRDRIMRGEVLGPRLWVPGPALSANLASSPAEGRRLVEEQKMLGADHLKIHENVTLETYDTIVATAKRVGLTFAGHVPDAVGVHHALAAGQKSIDHLDNYAAEIGGDDAKLAELVRATRTAGAWTVPTMALWEVFAGTVPMDSLAARPELRYVPPQWVTAWRQHVTSLRRDEDAGGAATVMERRRILKALRDGGAPIAFGTDSPQLFSVPGFSVHREMQAMLAAGLTPFEILAAGTRNVGRYYGREANFGTIAAGKRADLVLLDANPLVDLRNFSRRAGVMVLGRWLPEAEIQTRLAQIAAQFGAN